MITLKDIMDFADKHRLAFVCNCAIRFRRDDSEFLFLAKYVDSSQGYILQACTTLEHLDPDIDPDMSRISYCGFEKNKIRTMDEFEDTFRSFIPKYKKLLREERLSRISSL